MAISEDERDMWHQAADRARRTYRSELSAFIGNVDLTEDERAFVAHLANNALHEPFMSLVAKIAGAPEVTSGS